MDELAQTIVFRGVDVDEAEAFIQAIRQLAYKEDEDDDNVWMARFATTCFRGRAMRWHARLDVAVRRDWDILVQAILDEWSMEVTDENRGEAAALIVPTPARAQGLDQALLFAQPSPGDWCTGRIRVIRDCGLTAGFLSVRNPGGYSRVEVSFIPQSASLFRCIFANGATRMGLWDSAGSSTGYALTLKGGPKRQLWAGDSAYGANSSASRDLDIWVLASDGTLCLIWTDEDSLSHLSTDLDIPMFGFDITPAGISTPQKASFPGDYYRASLEFEQTV